MNETKKLRETVHLFRC